MHAATVILLFCTLVRLGQGTEDILGLPLDYDGGNYNDGQELEFWNKEQNIWDEPPKQEPTRDSSPEKALKKLCEQYDLTLGDIPIDCAKLRVTQKTLKIQEHDLQKREVLPDEGSGDGDQLIETEEEQTPVEKPTAEPSSQQQGEPSQKEEEPSQKEEEPSQKEEEPPQKGEETSQKEEEPPKKGEEPSEAEPKHDEEETLPEEEKATPLEAVVIPENKESVVAPKEEGKSVTPQPVANEVTVGKPVQVSEEDKSVKPLEVEETPAKENTPTVLPDEGQPEQLEAGQKEVREGGEEKKGRKLAEEINSVQSGNAVDESILNAEEGEKKVSSTRIKSASIAGADEPNTGESASPTGTSRKDTSLLIGLFAAVLAVGSAAFAYNYIKKRRRTASRTQNGIPKSDPEQGREMKPLMKNAESKPIEDDKLEEVKE